MEEGPEAAPVEMFGLQLWFQRVGLVVTVTHAEDGLWVATVFRLHTEKPCVSPSWRFRAVLGRSDVDRHGAHVRRAIAAHAAKVYKSHD